MTTQDAPRKSSLPDEGEKNPVMHVEGSEHDDQLQKPLDNDVDAEFDAFGARKKTDPKEVALVRKLDLYMMVRAALRVPWLSGGTSMLTALFCDSPSFGPCTSSTSSTETP